MIWSCSQTYQQQQQGKNSDCQILWAFMSGLTLKCIRGDPVGSKFSFWRLLLKRLNIFPPTFVIIAQISATHLLVKNEIGCAAVSTLISINEHLGVTKIVLAAIFEWNIFIFQILFQQCECIYVLLLWAKFYWKIPSGKKKIQILFTWLFLRNENSFLAAILKQYIFFTALWLF